MKSLGNFDPGNHWVRVCGAYGAPRGRHRPGRAVGLQQAGTAVSGACLGLWDSPGALRMPDTRTQRFPGVK